MEAELLIHSAAVATLATGVALVAGVPVALALQWLSPWGRRALVALALLVLALPGFFVAGMWMERVGFAGAWRVGEGWWTVRLLPLVLSGWVLGLLLWPVPALLLAGAWDRLDRRLLEANPELHGTPLLRHLFWPAMIGPLVPAAGLVAVLALGQFSVPALFQARVWPAEIWVDFSTRFDTAGALLKCWPLALAALALAAIALRKPLAWPRTAGGISGDPVRRRLGLPVCAASAFAVAAVLTLSAGLPLAVALGNPRTWTELGPAALAAGPAALRSGLMAASTATLVLGLALGLAPWRWPALSAVPFVLPGVFTGVAMAGLASLEFLAPLRSTPWVVLAAFTVRYGFVGWYLARRVWRGADPRLRDVARLEGAGLWAEWRHVLGTRSARGLAGAWLVVYLLALWDVETLILVVPPGGDTLSLTIFNLLHYGHNAQVTALCLLLAALAALPVLGWTLASRLRRGAPAAAMAALSLAAGIGAGCSPAQGPASDGDATAAIAGAGASLALDSRVFSRVEVIGARGTGPGFFSKPRSVVVDADDQVYAVDMTGRVQRFDATGRWVLGWQMPETDKGKAKGMALARDGSVLVVEPHYHRVNRFAPDGKLLAQWGTHGTNAGQFWFPRAIATAPSGDLWVSEYGVVERVQRFQPDGAGFVGGFGEGGTGPGQLNRAEGIGVDPAGNVYVADSCNHRIQVFAPDGRALRTHGRAGRGPGEFSYPYDVRVDAAGWQYVCEFGNSRVQILDARDQVVEILGGPGGSPGRMNNPWSLCLDSHGNLYVADSLNHRLQKFTRRAGLAGLAVPTPPANRAGPG